MKEVTLADRARAIVNEIPIGEDFLKDDICDKLGCSRKSLNYCFTDMLSRGDLTARTAEGSRLYIYRRVKQIKQLYHYSDGKPNFSRNRANTEQVALFSDFTDPWYLFTYGGNSNMLEHANG